MEIRPAGDGGRTDGHDEANSRFSQIYERAWKKQTHEDMQWKVRFNDRK
jgi:hypothetical protein